MTSTQGSHETVVAVVTTIQAPTPALVRLASRFDGRLVVVGDRKTPSNWHHPGVEYLPPQLEGPGPLATLLPWDHYGRKMLGYIRAVARGAQAIYDTDDDNEPTLAWDVVPFDGVFTRTPRNAGFVNIYRSFTDRRIWPRGLPLDAIANPGAVVPEASLVEAACRVGVWQLLVDGEPDVDAIYRLVDGEPCEFRKRNPIVLDYGTVCPFNSQATLVRAEIFALLYLPTTVTFRFTDILRGLVAQPIMWAAGYHLGFAPPTVVQVRNPHELMRDFADEVPMYLHASEVPDIVAHAIRGSGASCEENLLLAYRGLAAEGIVSDDEFPRLDRWLDELAMARSVASR